MKGGPCGPPFMRKVSRLLQYVGDVAERVAQALASVAHRGDRSDRDQGRNQRVLDGSDAIRVLHKTAENGQHKYLQKNRCLAKHACRAGMPNLLVGGG